MKEETKYFQISKKGHLHILSDRIPVNWVEVLIFPIPFFIVLTLFSHWIVGLIISVLSGILYLLFRFASWIFYSELIIDDHKQNLVRQTKFLEKITKTEIITDKIEVDRFKFEELHRSGKIKYLMKYETFKDFDLIILRNKTDKKLIVEFLKNINPKINV